jgi:N-acetylgalactosamine-N,N'-diacetylbacillosaminyl-diphospho-undecaprenol 4-alpha-N-acetylgalactosaminyltransferase
MKINFLINTFGSGGAQRNISILLKELKDYEIELVLFTNEIFFDIPDNVKVTILGKNDKFKFFKLFYYAYKYSKIDCDVSISFLNRANYVNILSKLFGNRAKIIVSHRISIKEYSGISLKNLVVKFLMKLYNFADLVVVNSKNVKEELINFGIKRIKVIYNPVIKKECKKEIDEFIFLNIARLEAQKNHKLLIEAFKEANLNAKLWIVGEGSLKSELKKISNNKIKFLGNIKDITPVLRKSSAFVLTSNYEGLPNVILEALACRIPVISTWNNSEEILKPKGKSDLEISEFGIIVKSKKALIRALKKIYY